MIILTKFSILRLAHRLALFLALVVVMPGFTVYAAPAGGYIGPAAGLEAAASSGGATGTKGTGEDGAKITDASGGVAKINASGESKGGRGENGNNSQPDGEKGGIGVNFTGVSNFLENAGLISGGKGGKGGKGKGKGKGKGSSYGGNGGIGVKFKGDNNTLKNSGSITGGKGGNGGSGISTSNAGSGGLGVKFKGNGNSLENSGSIAGGDGGNGGSGAVANGGNGKTGVRFTGDDNVLTNSGTISGGFDSDGITRGNAVVFEGMNNRLVIKNGAVFEGKVKATASSGDTLAFGGDENQSFDSSTIADSTSAGEQFDGFESVEIGSGAKVTLTGTSVYTQDTVIKRGELDVAGNLSSTTIKLEVGGTLNGIGTIGTVVFAAGSVHAPGNSIGTQTINGNYSLANGILEIEVTPGIANDQVIVNGTVDLNQGNLRILGLDEVSTGAETANHVIILNDRSDAVVGVFDSIDNQLAFYDVEVSYSGGDGNDVVLELERNILALSEVAITENQIAVAGVFDTQTGTADFQSVLGAIIAGSKDDARGAIDMLAGDIHAAAPHVHRLLHERTWSTLSNRLSRNGKQGAPLSSLIKGTEVQVGAYVPNGKAPVIDDEAPRVWVEAIAGYGNLDASGRIGSAETEFDWGGGIVGYEIGGSGPLTLGAYFQFAEINIDQPGRLAGINSTQAATGIYAGYQLPDDWKLAAHLGGSWLDSDSRRQLLFGGLNRTAIGDYEDFQLVATLEIAKTFYVGETGYLEPFASMTGRREREGAFNETGAGAANLLRGSDTDYFANSILGARFGGEWKTENGAWSLRPRAQVGWQHRYGSVDNDFQTSFQGAPIAFTSSGTDTARNSIVGTVGIECLSLDNGMSLYADYGFSLSSKHDEHTFGAGVSIPW